MMNIRLKRFPEKTTDFLCRGRVIIVGDAEIKWDAGIRAWECSLPGVGLMRSYLIGRVVDGEVLVTENVLHDRPAQGPLATRATAVLEGLLAAGEDLGQWGRSEG